MGITNPEPVRGADDHDQAGVPPDAVVKRGYEADGYDTKSVISVPRKVESMWVQAARSRASVVTPSARSDCAQRTMAGACMAVPAPATRMIARQPERQNEMGSDGTGMFSIRLVVEPAVGV